MTYDWQALLTPEIKEFIKTHENTDVRELALKKCPSQDWPYGLILDQIKARQKAKTKIPQWLDNENIIFPASDTLEQASSSATAAYKANLFKGKICVDLTGGAGIDSWAMLKNFESGTVIDAHKETATLLGHNLGILSQKPITSKHVQAEDYVKTMPHVDLALIDPQRRTDNRKGLYKLEDCNPNILMLLPDIKANTILLKTSPMYDIDQGIEQLPNTSHVHVVEYDGDCKELLFVINPNKQSKNVQITIARIGSKGEKLQNLTFTRNEEQNATLTIDKPLKYLYEPYPAFLKAGCFKYLCERYKTAKLHPHTHLYTSNTPITDFPGRIFEIVKIHNNIKSLSLKKANLSTRNYPEKLDILKKKLKIRDGGNDYLFACTAKDPQTIKNEHIILQCLKT